jgi:hypothetical protein
MTDVAWVVGYCTHGDEDFKLVRCTDVGGFYALTQEECFDCDQLSTTVTPCLAETFYRRDNDPMRKTVSLW